MRNNKNEIFMKKNWFLREMLKGEITIFVYSIFIFLNFNEKILFQFCSLKKKL